jgi:transposase
MNYFILAGIETKREGIYADEKQILHESTLEGKPRGHRPRVLTGKDEARLISLVCGPAPEGCPCWTLKLLEATWVTLEHTDAPTVSRETIRRTLKKTNLNPGKTGNGVFPRKRTGSL